MHIDNLIKMANQIGGFFEAMPDRDEALADIASHLKRFWEPRMRRALLAHVDATDGGEGLIPIVQAAVARHREKLEITLRAPMVTAVP
ncbi:formate dehydrogenase delta subunit [Cupriavidus sp. OV038]|jgi:formate dehydrogenase subunit delta|uniref:formate dehydrogenase subunit delta n=1 Tax=unclassified Cupriavidus TaxID=2640874 RepID=UPI0008E71188|nr:MULTISPECIES: formate dehydrogenase subunit delta [unclassified Cupriavidus]SFD09888.1 formate dehydrogenase delta subunit [Cupriavidus sp. OV038]SFP75174.1 formate dehydrogenase delta subunit [Cupriavidus sp. OV096]